MRAYAIKSGNSSNACSTSTGRAWRRWSGRSPLWERPAATCSMPGTGDELIASLMLLYDLHPEEAESRVRGALDKVRPYLQSHGGNVEYLGISDGVVHLRMQGKCNGCPSSEATARSTIEEAIYAAAPDVAGIEVEGVVSHSKHAASSFVPLEQVVVRK